MEGESAASCPASRLHSKGRYSSSAESWHLHAGWHSSWMGLAAERSSPFQLAWPASMVQNQYKHSNRSESTLPKVLCQRILPGACYPAFWNLLPRHQPGGSGPHFLEVRQRPVARMRGMPFVVIESASSNGAWLHPPPPVTPDFLPD